jgi:ribosomal protein S27AE
MIDAAAHKRKARETAVAAINAGRLSRQPCETCGAPETEAHHDDYSQPLAVRWLCKKCHGLVHRGPRYSHCRRGHPMSGANLLLSIEYGFEKRRCRTCRNARKLKYYHAHPRKKIGSTA